MRPYTPPTRMARRGEQRSPSVTSATRSQPIYSHLLMHIPLLIADLSGKIQGIGSDRFARRPIGTGQRELAVEDANALS